jgi:hypothetical protein
MTTRKGIHFNEKTHRYSIDGKYAVSVTTALNGIPKGALVPWAAGSVAEYVVDHLEDVRRLVGSGGRGPAIQFLKGIPDQKRDSAAIRGTTVHDYAELILPGGEVEVPEDLVPYVQGYLHYIEDWNPRSVYNEIIVGSRTHNYAGRLDSVQDVPGLGLVIVDYKAGNRVYGEAALQVSAYRHAETFMDGDVEKPMPEVFGTYVLHIQPNEYELIPLDTGPEVFAKFLAAKANYLENVQSNKLAKLLGEPLTPPGREVDW